MLMTGTFSTALDSRGKLALASAIVIAVALSLLHLPYPFDEDQAMFMVGARELADGASMYGQFWDMKQPGAYWWYLTAGRLFGFDEVGVRWMDVCWSAMLAFAVSAAVRHRGALAAVLAPGLVFGSFYAFVTPFQLSQVEWLVGLPLTVMLWCVCGGERAGSGSDVRRYFFIGSMLAVVALFKLMLMGVALAMLAVAVFLNFREGAVTWRRVFRQLLLPALAGGGLVLLPVIVWMATHDTLAKAVWTTFVYPGQVLREYQRHSVHMLFDSFGWFLSGVWMLLPWAAWAVYVGVRRASRLELLCATWCVTGFLIVAAQPLSYWTYHFDLFFIPVGVLAALGFCDALERTGARGRTGVRFALVAAMVLGTLVSIAWPVMRKAEQVAAARPFSPAARRAFAAVLNPGWISLGASADAVRGFRQDSDRVVVWGDPRLYFLVGNRPIVEVHGATYYLSKQLEEVTEIVRDKRPPLVYISKYRDGMTYLDGGIFPRMIKELYVPCYENTGGVWYRLKPPL
jgi:hypothetical protein